MERGELRIAGLLACIFFLRMLGLFMLLPVLALYGDRLAGATPLLIGAALGIYGLSQAALQIPMGRLSDRIGRKPVITIGLLIFAAGGIVASLGGHIATILAGRALQGAGAISGAALALASDLTRPQQRTKVMAIIGVSIGISFSLAFILGPIIDAWIGLRGLFLVTAGLGIAALPILWFGLPTPASTSAQSPPITPTSPTSDASLRALYAGVFCLHAILAASFVSIPLVLQTELGIASRDHYVMYLPVLLLSMFAVGPMIMLSHRPSLGLGLFRAAILCLAMAESVMWLGPSSKLVIGFGLVAFFVGFNFLEASLPSMISQAAPQAGRGQALGTYSMAQFIGMFAGGLSGGAILGAFSVKAVFGACTVAGLAWAAHTWLLPPPNRLTATDTN